MESPEQLTNYIAGAWQASRADQLSDVYNPATNEVRAHVPFTPAAEANEAVRAADEAFVAWRRTPVTERIQYLFQFKEQLERHQEDLAHVITDECGKTLAESRGELRRGIDNVEVACGMPALMQGDLNEDVSRDVDEYMIRQPLGVVAAITPFNFPGMIPLWFLPYALACGNCFILKPSEKVPQTAQRLFELLDEIDLPAGVAQLVHGSAETARTIIDHPDVRGISFVGSTPTAREVYRRATARGKRAQCQGGAKNTVVILPDARMDKTTEIVADSAFGCAGQRCLANSLAITVGDAREMFSQRIVDAAASRSTGYGGSEGVQMGPVISPSSKERIEGLIERAEDEGARLAVDGRRRTVSGYEKGNFIFPTVLDDVPPDGEIARTEIFGPVFGLQHVDTIEDAVERINAGGFGNMACLFASRGAAARRFRYAVDAGNIGINIGVAAPMAFYPFSGWKDSFFGDLHAQGKHAVEFYTQTKVVVERWL